MENSSWTKTTSSSLSGTLMLTIACQGRSLDAPARHPRAERQAYLENRSTLRMIGRGDLAIVLFHDAVANRESQTSSLP